MGSDGLATDFCKIFPKGSYSETWQSLTYWSIDFKGSVEDVDARLRTGKRVRWGTFPLKAVANRITRTRDLAITNIDSLVVSDRLRAVLSALCGTDLQFIPVTITNRSGTVLREPYWVVNCLRLIDCIDKKKSKRLDVGDDRICYEWVYFAKHKVPKSISMFRVKHDDFQVVIRASLASAIRAAGLTGVEFLAAGAPWEKSPVE